MQVRRMCTEDREAVLSMADALYHSDAVDHPVPRAMMERAFLDAVGQQFFQWLYGAYPDAVRFRLEVTRDNRAAHLYERNGFHFIDDCQMVYDV